MAGTIANPLSLDELKDALYRLADVIERTEYLAAQSAEWVTDASGLIDTNTTTGEMRA